jgi:alpha-2-macroglobulin
MNKNPFLSWQFMLLKVIALALLALFLEKPVGSISGRVSLEESGFHLSTFDIKNNHVYVVASGSGKNSDVELGTWVNSDGTFKISQLPIGEYSVKIRATGFETEYRHGAFVYDGKITDVGDQIALSVLTPSVTIASNTRVYSSQEHPYFWINATGATDATIKLYKVNVLNYIGKNPDEPAPEETTANNQSDSEEDNHPGETTVPDTGKPNFGTNMELYKPYDSAEKSVLKMKQKPYKTLTRHLESGSDDWARADFKLDPLPRGDYFAVAEIKNQKGQSDWNMIWFNVSDVGLIMKTDSYKAVVQAVDLNTLHPIKDVSVDIYDRKDKGLKKLGKSVKTNDGGFAELPIYGVPASTILAVATAGADRAYSGIYSSGAVKDSDRYEAYFYTDRPVYRLGQTVFFKSICRENSNKGLRTPAANLPIHVSVQDPDNNNIWEGDLKTNDHGCIAGSVKVPDDSKTGGYSLILQYADGTQENESFEVAEYRKPEYEVTVKALTPHVVAGEKAKVNLKATYYFGAPVANAKISYSIYSSSDWGLRWRLLPRPAYMSYFDDWDSDDDGSSGDGNDNSYSYGGDFLTQGTANTDANGEAIIEFDTTRPQFDATNRNNYDYSDKRYRVECEVTDLSRMSVTSSASLSVTMADFALFSDTDSYVYKAGDPVRANVTTIDYLGKPVANQTVTASLVRWAYDLSTNDYKDREVIKSTEVVTDSAGKATVAFATTPDFATDSYRISITANDKFGRTVSDQNSVWIASSAQPFFSFGEQAQKEPLTIRLDKKAYKIGDVAKVMISGPITGKEGIQAFISLESDTLLKYWTLPMDASAKMIELPIEGTFEPNIYISVAFATKNHQFYHESKSIRVSPAEHFLNLNIATDKPKYSPGETVHYTIKALLPNGKPSPNTELSLGLVDESIYAIRAENAPDIVKFFYRKRSNGVTTICSFPEQYSGGPDKIEPRVRKDFKDTAVWLPSLKTNTEGIAIANVKLPDNLTTWRATVRAASIGNEFGSAVNKIVSTQDFIVRLALPRFFTTGDEGIVTAIVHNYTDSVQRAKVSLTLSDQLHTDETLTTTLSLAPSGVGRHSWPVKAISVGQAIIGVKATGSKSGDAMETKLPIIPLGIPAFTVASGVLRDDPANVTIPLGVASDAVPGTTKYKLTVASSSIGPVLGNFDSLIQYPYGCVEQTMSRLMPSIVALTLNKKLNIPISAENSKLFAKVYKVSMAKLDGYQHADGGWGWWETDESNVYLTSLVLEGYKRLEAVKYPVDAERKKNGLAWLSKNIIRLHQQLIDPHKATPNYYWEEPELYTDLARGCYTLALHGQKPDDKVLAWLDTNIHRLSAESLAYLSMAHQLRKSDAGAKQALDELISIAKQSKDNCVWQWDEGVTRKRLGISIKQRYVWNDYRFTDVETTALGLQAVLMVNPDDTDLIERIKNWLLERRAVSGWENTKATAEVFMALLEEQLQFSKGKQTNCTLDITETSSLLQEFIFNLANQFGPEQNAKIPVPDKSESLVLSKKGDGRIYYSSLLEYQRRLLPGDKIAAKSTPDGLSLSRTFFHIQPVAATSDGKMHFTHTPLTQNEIHAGETVLMKVTLDNPIGLPYVMLECALPSGAEVVQNSSEADAVNSEESSMGDWNRAWWTHQDILDDRIVFFVTHLRPGKAEFNTLVRMEMPGKFQINPIKMEGMYTNKVRGYSELGTVTVKE